jgi:membrane-bound ClpP family serine protease
MTGESLFFPVLLQLVGVGIIIAEFILPSGGLLSVLAAGVIGYSLYLVFSSFSMAAGMVFVTADLILLPILVIVGLRLLAASPLSLRRQLSSKEGVSSQSPDMKALLGREGVALSDLRPSGVARIDGNRIDVVSRGDYIPKASSLVVCDVTGNQVIVKLIDPEQKGDQ